MILGGGLVTKSCVTLGTPWTVACQAPLSMGFPRREYQSGLPFTSLAGLPDAGIKTRSSHVNSRTFHFNKLKKKKELSYKTKQMVICLQM